MIFWNKEMMEEDVKWITYDEWMNNNDEMLLSGLKHLTRYGLLFLKDVPDDEKAVERISERMGEIRQTFYGRTWDVKSVPQAKNVAYVNVSTNLDALVLTENPQLYITKPRPPYGPSLLRKPSWHPTSTLSTEQCDRWL